MCSVQRPKLTKYPFSFVFVVALFTAVRYALEALYVGEVVEYKQLFEIQVGVKQVSLGCCCCFVATGG